MSVDKDKNLEQFSNLIEIMENAGQKQIPDDFATQVMEVISEEKEAVQFSTLRRLFSTRLDFSLRQSVTKTECAFYFLLTGFFYFMIGLIMMIGLPLPAVMQNNGWLSFQPLFGLLLAAELAIMGIVLYKRGDSAVRFVRIGTLLYAALIILNFGVGALYIQSVAAVFFIAVFSMTGLVLAVLLGIAVDHYRPGSIFSEVHG